MVEPHIEQIEMLEQQLDLLGDENKWSAVRGGYGSAKTYTLCYWVWGRMEEFPYATASVCGADFGQLKRGFFKTFRGILDKHGLTQGVDFHYTESPTPTLKFFHNGATLTSLSAEQEDSIHSVEIQTLVCEEPQTWQRGEEFYKILTRRLRVSEAAGRKYPGIQARGRMSFNPPSTGHWLYSLCEKQWKKPGWICHRFSTRGNVLMPDIVEYVAQIEATTAVDLLPNVLDGHYSTVGGSVYRGFDPDIHGVAPEGLPPIAVDPSRPLLWCLDFNVHLMCSIVAQQHLQRRVMIGMVEERGRPPEPRYEIAVPGWQRKVWYALDELRIPDAGAVDAAKEFMRRYGDIAKRAGVILYGDASGGQRNQGISSTVRARSNWEMVIETLYDEGLPEHKLDHRIQKANPPVDNRVNAMRSQFKSGSGYGFLIDLNACPYLVKDFAEVQYLEGKNEIDKRNNALTHCFVAGTMVSTEYGDVCIEDVRPGAKVWTRNGLRRVVASGVTSISAETVTASMSNGAVLCGTPDHPIFVPALDAFVPMGKLLPGQEVLSKTRWMSSNLTEIATGNSLALATIEDSNKSRERLSIFTAICGKASSVLSRLSTTSTMLMETRKTIGLRTLSAFQAASTMQSILSNAPHGEESALKAGISTECARLQRHGTHRRKEDIGIPSTAKKAGTGEGLLQKSVSNVASLMRRAIKRSLTFAQTRAPQQIAGHRESTTLNLGALCAKSLSSETNTLGPLLAVSRVEHIVANEKKETVYDLTVDVDHEFFANGILVHNCSDAMAYAVWMQFELDAGREHNMYTPFMER